MTNAEDKLNEIIEKLPNQAQVNAKECVEHIKEELAENLQPVGDKFSKNHDLGQTIKDGGHMVNEALGNLETHPACKAMKRDISSASRNL